MHHSGADRHAHNPTQHCRGLCTWWHPPAPRTIIYLYPSLSPLLCMMLKACECTLLVITPLCDAHAWATASSVYDAHALTTQPYKFVSWAIASSVYDAQVLITQTYKLVSWTTARSVYDAHARITQPYKMYQRQLQVQCSVADSP